LLADLDGSRSDDGSCLTVRVRAQEGADTVGSSRALSPAQAPQLWISDSSVWTSQITTWRYRVVGSLASTPVILASTTEAVRAAGWATTPPTWTQAMTKARHLSVPGLDDQAPGQLAMLALWQSAGRGAAADQA